MNHISTPINHLSRPIQSIASFSVLMSKDVILFDLGVGIKVLFRALLASELHPRLYTMTLSASREKLMKIDENSLQGARKKGGPKTYGTQRRAK